MVYFPLVVTFPFFFFFSIFSYFSPALCCVLCVNLSTTGMGDRNNGVNFMRAACVIAMEKAQMSFEPMLESLRTRSAHIMKRLFPIVEEMVRKSSISLLGGSSSSGGGGGMAGLGAHSAQFQQIMKATFDKFVDEKVEICIQRCREDLIGMTRSEYD